MSNKTKAGWNNYVFEHSLMNILSFGVLAKHLGYRIFEVQYDIVY